MNLVLYVFHAGPPAERSSGKPPGRGHLQMDHQDHQERFSFINSFFILFCLFYFSSSFSFFFLSFPFPPRFPHFSLSSFRFLMRSASACRIRSRSIKDPYYPHAQQM